MKIIFLGKENSPVLDIIRNSKDEVYQTEEPLVFEALKREKFDFLVSHGYRHIIKKDILDLFPSRAINLHISYLPWNRGASPNLWSWFDSTPKGVTIHHIDEGVDTGDIIIQREVMLSDEETLSSSYNKLQTDICELFAEHWSDIKEGKSTRKIQLGNGSAHKLKDQIQLEYLLTDGWDTPVKKLKK